MKSILLVQLPTSHFGAGEKVYPLGLARLSSLVPEWMSKETLDMNLHVDPWPLLKEALEGQRPEIVVLSFRNVDPLGGHKVSYVSSLKTAALMVRKLRPEARILAGGPAFTLFAKRLMEEAPDIDFGLAGEGENGFPLLIMSDTVCPELIPGLVWRRNGKIICNLPDTGISMKDLPGIDTKLFNPGFYQEGNKYVAAMGIEGKRGCDLQCSYCLYPLLGHKKVRLRKPVHIVDEMEFLHKEYGINLFHFTDSLVNRPADHFKALCIELLNRDLGLQWTGFFREDTFTMKSALLAEKAGLSAVYFSADALNHRGLHLLNKKLTTQDILRASKVCVEAEVLTMCHFLVNLPLENNEDYGESRETMEKILHIHHGAGNLGAVIFNNIRLYPKAIITDMLLKKGLIGPDADLLYPVYYDPPEGAHILHELEALCHSAGVFSRLGMNCAPLPVNRR